MIGSGIIILGLRLTLGSANSGVVQFISKREIDAETLLKIVGGARHVFSYVEQVFKPRLGFMLKPPFLNGLGFSIVVSGIALSLPLPPVILLSNALPAWAIILLCLGYLQRDGVVILGGHLLTVGTWCYFAIWWEAIKFGFQSLLSFFG